MLLFTPLHINGILLPNRLILPAMVTRLSGEDGFVNKDIRERYLRFAQGEPGMIVIEAMAVHSAKSGPLLRICEDDYIPALADLAKSIHDISPCKSGAADHSFSENCAERLAAENQGSLRAGHRIDYRSVRRRGRACPARRIRRRGIAHGACVYAVFVLVASQSAQRSVWPVAGKSNALDERSHLAGAQGSRP